VKRGGSFTTAAFFYALASSAVDIQPLQGTEPVLSCLLCMGRHSSFLLFRNGSEGWCAAPPGFRNLLRDPVGCGPTRADAVSDLFAHPEYVLRAKMGEWPANPSSAMFVEGPKPDSIAFRRDETPRPISGRTAAHRAVKLVCDRGTMQATS